MPVVHDQVIKKLQWVDELIYGTGKFLFESFRIAIFLGLGKILLMSILSLLQFRRSRHLKAVPRTTINGKVSVIVPAYNEEVNAVKTLQKLLKQDYPGLEIIFVDDGSTDQTFDKVSRAFISDNRVQVFTKPNGGKASALNFGIERTDADYVVCIDADTQLMPDAIRQLMLKFEDKFVAAVAGCVKVGNQNNLLTKWQAIEYITAQNFDRRAFDFVNGITVVPGAIGAFRKTAIQQAGGFTTDTLAEDCDLTIRILRNGHIIRNCSEAVAVTEAPETLKQFMKQRFRWSYGVMQSFWKNKDACFNPKYKALGMLSLPNILLFQMILPLFAPLADLLFFFSLAWNYGNPESIHQILLFYGLFLFVDLAVSLMAFSFEKENFRKLIWILPQRFIYRQLMYIIFFRSIMKAIKGEKQGWGVLKRTGNVELRVETA
jgi:cellulose synthase/poly-beta-1,6-N-acetylglucosamine synthase-like glycosyltransferase